MKNTNTAVTRSQNVQALPETGWHDVDTPTGALSVQLGSVTIEHGRRYLLTVNHDGTPNVAEIPRDASIATQERYLQMMLEPNGMYVSTAALQAFVDAATARLNERRQFNLIAGGAA